MARKRIASIAAAASAAALMTVAGATSAHAEGVGVGGGGRPVTREPNMPTTWTFAAGEVCPFKTTIVDLVNQTTTLVFPNGESRGSGRLVEKITNDETGKTVTRNISGPGASTYGPNGEWILTLTGSSIFWAYDGTDTTGKVGKGLFIGHGPLVYVDLMLVKAPPSFENLCDTVG
jgi:hypothetical protein